MHQMSDKPNKEWIGPSDFARYRDVSLRTVKDWIEEGRLENCFKIGNNKRKKINWQLADQALENSASDQENDSVSGTTKGTPSNLVKARTAKTMMEANSAKIKYELLAGTLVKTDEVIEVAKQMARLTRESIMTLPDRLGPILAGETDFDEVHRILTEELNTALRNLALKNFDFFKGKKGSDES